MDIEAIFCQIDDFCQHCEAVIDRGALPATTGKRTRKRASMLSLSEVMTIMVWFHQQGYRTFKDFYTKHVLLHMRSAFPRLPSYNRFVELQSDAALPLELFLRSVRLARPTGVAFIDSTPLAVCDNHRIAQHTVFRAQARRGKTSTGWFYGFKLHLVVNNDGELVSCVLSPGNVDDRDQRVIEPLSARLWGKLVGDRGYVSKTLSEQLLNKGITLITKLKKGMANKLMPTMDKFLLSKRGIIESVNDLLKNSCYVEHTRHRSSKNFVANLASGLIASTFLQKAVQTSADAVSDAENTAHQHSRKGVQIDLLLDRKDGIINIIEMKFYNAELTLTQADASTLRTRLQRFAEATGTRKQLVLTLVTVFGLQHNHHSLGLVEECLTLDDLFAE